LCEAIAAEAKRPLAETHYPMILAPLTTGARISTVRALRREDFEPEAGIVHLRRRFSKRAVLPGVKRSRTSKDIAGLLPELYVLLEARRAAFNERQKESGLVFPSRLGGPMARSVLDKPIRSICTKARITKRLTPHGFRRTAALAYRLAGSSELAKDVLGHRTDEMHRHYAPSKRVRREMRPRERLPTR
jgi:integrase